MPRAIERACPRRAETFPVPELEPGRVRGPVFGDRLGRTESLEEDGHLGQHPLTVAHREDARLYRSADARARTEHALPVAKRTARSLVPAQDQHTVILHRSQRRITWSRNSWGGLTA